MYNDVHTFHTLYGLRGVKAAEEKYNWKKWLHCQILALAKKDDILCHPHGMRLNFCMHNSPKPQFRTEVLKEFIRRWRDYLLSHIQKETHHHNTQLSKYLESLRFLSFVIALWLKSSLLLLCLISYRKPIQRTIAW